MDFLLARLECRGFVTKSKSIEASHQGPILKFLLSKTFLPKISLSIASPFILKTCTSYKN